MQDQKAELKQLLPKLAAKLAVSLFLSNKVAHPLLEDITGRSIRKLPLFFITDLLLSRLISAPSPAERKVEEAREEEEEEPRFGNIFDFASKHYSDNRLVEAEVQLSEREEASLDEIIDTIFGKKGNE